MRVIEQAPSREAAAAQLRTDIELPGALRYLDRRRRSLQAALTVIRGLLADCFVAITPSLQGFARVLGDDCVLLNLRGRVARYLPQLPTPFGFNPHRDGRETGAARRQHKMGPDPPVAVLQARR